MSYMREPLYVWTSDSLHEDVCPASCEDTSHLLLNIWFREGTDEVWNAFPSQCPQEDGFEGFEAGFTVRMDYFDHLVVMRYAELQQEGRVQAVTQSALNCHGGNFGSRSLQLLAG